ncbi:hypothetical protein JTB14_010562 [Gonioctena quinquepunctata]|nr:hypothetical protein JTB14_010562 [Gonioctena quinquepunctata]
MKNPPKKASLRLGDREFLMKNMKLQGGLTHGRGVGEGLLARRTMGITTVQHVSEQIENLCRVSLHTSEQHVPLKHSAVLRYNRDGNKIYEWLRNISLFSRTSIYTDSAEVWWLTNVSTAISPDNWASKASTVC